MDEFRVFSALFDNSLDVKLGVFDKLINGLNRKKYAVFFLIFVNAEIWLSRNQKSVFIDQCPDTEA